MANCVTNILTDARFGRGIHAPIHGVLTHPLEDLCCFVTTARSLLHVKTAPKHISKILRSRMGEHRHQPSRLRQSIIIIFCIKALQCGIRPHRVYPAHRFALLQRCRTIQHINLTQQSHQRMHENASVTSNKSGTQEGYHSIPKSWPCNPLFIPSATQPNCFSPVRLALRVRCCTESALF